MEIRLVLFQKTSACERYPEGKFIHDVIQIPFAFRKDGSLKSETQRVLSHTIMQVIKYDDLSMAIERVPVNNK